MSFFDNIFKRNTKMKTAETEQRGFNYTSFADAIQYSNIGSFSSNYALNLSTVYRCVNLISSTMAQLPIEIFSVDADGNKTKNYNHYAQYILNNEPDPILNRYEFVRLMIQSMLLKGNAYALIERNQKGQCVGLKYIDSNYVTIEYDPIKRTVFYHIAGYNKKIEDCNIIHLVNISSDGVNGVSTLTYAANTLNIARHSEETAQAFFEQGANIQGVLKLSKPAQAKQKQELKNAWLQAFGEGQGGTVVLDNDVDFQRITFNSAEAQLLESRLFNVSEICRFFNVSPCLAYDLTKASYSTVEANQLEFLTSTIAPICAKLEQQLMKIFLPYERRTTLIKFNTAVILRGDKTTLANYYSSLFNAGLMTQNEIRQELDLNRLEAQEADNAYIQVNLQQSQPDTTATPSNTTNQNTDSKEDE